MGVGGIPASTTTVFSEWNPLLGSYQLVLPAGLSDESEAAYIIQHCFRAYKRRKMYYETTAMLNEVSRQYFLNRLTAMRNGISIPSAQAKPENAQDGTVTTATTDPDTDNNASTTDKSKNNNNSTTTGDVNGEESANNGNANSGDVLMSAMEKDILNNTIMQNSKLVLFYQTFGMLENINVMPNYYPFSNANNVGINPFQRKRSFMRSGTTFEGAAPHHAGGGGDGNTTNFNRKSSILMRRAPPRSPQKQVSIHDHTTSSSYNHHKPAGRGSPSAHPLSLPSGDAATSRTRFPALSFVDNADAAASGPSANNLMGTTASLAPYVQDMSRLSFTSPSVYNNTNNTNNSSGSGTGERPSLPGSGKDIYVYRNGSGTWNSNTMAADDKRANVTTLSTNGNKNNNNHTNMNVNNPNHNHNNGMMDFSERFSSASSAPLARRVNVQPYAFTHYKFEDGNYGSH
ncbi:ubiquitin domain-containing protein [Strigomonas culicis]|uniref:Ubiquitin domain-containing protein n=1 Tax=Strigomonas culicis TaxID=28005 RepID=S9TFT9_9TRYP|nr:ubiquitin domain-containing protein [Strigomonas culicis]|eukprot:EPY15829.1 ubiquitin domain-containing protein [Strigomonas culicis]